MNVLLLRQEEEESDKYHLRFQDSLIGNVTSVPVLGFEYCNWDKIVDFVDTIDQYSGLIFTSRRAVTTFEKAVEPSDIEKIRQMADFTLYVVGRTTENCLKQLGLESVGSETGNAKELSDLVINQQENTEKPLMFLCGNLARETIPKRLTEKKIPNESISCYKTIPDTQFEKNLKNYLIAFTPDVVTFYSPSGAEFHMSSLIKLINGLGESVKVTCIGEYTAQAVRKLGINVSAVAEKPNPDSLFEAIKSIS